MTDHSHSGVIVCRRCRKAFADAGGARVACCPHCGAAVRPLKAGLRDNRLAVTLALAALAVLSIAMASPFIASEGLGGTRSYSLIGGIQELYGRGYVFLAAIILIFSVVFPYAKLVAIIAAIGSLWRLGAGTRQRLHRLATLTGRYSLLDILIVAVTIVVVRFDGVMHISAERGTWLFGVAVLLSMAAGFCVNLERGKNE